MRGKDVFINNISSQTISFGVPTTYIYALKCPCRAIQSLRHASHKQSSNTFLLASNCYLCRYSTLRRKGHLHQSRDFASTEGLAVQLEGMCARRESDICTIERLERERFGELFCGICEFRSVFACWLRFESDAHLLCSWYCSIAASRRLPRH